MEIKQKALVFKNKSFLFVRGFHGNYGQKTLLSAKSVYLKIYARWAMGFKNESRISSISSSDLHTNSIGLKA